MAFGLIISKIKSANDKLVGESFSRPKIGAISSRLIISDARVTDGVKPIIAAKNHTRGIPIKAVILLRPLTSAIIDIIKETCIPDTAIIWLSR